MSFTHPPEINGPALKAARKKAGIDIAELATQCCLSSKMIVELEEGGMKSFYNHQLKVSAAKRVGSYLGLATEDYLEYRIDVAQNANIGDDENGQLVEETVLAKEDAPKALVDEGELLDEVIYESTNSGTSLPQVKGRATPTKWLNVSLVVFIGAVSLYGINSQFNVSGKAINLFEQSDTKPSNNPEPPKELVAQEPQEIAAEEKLTTKPEIKSESSAGTLVSQNQCPQFRDDQLLTYKSPNPSKLGDVVNIKTLIKQTICVVDSQGRQMLVDLDQNTAHAFKGAPPFAISAQDLDNVEMYFQGWRVRLPNAGIKSLRLIEVAIP